MTRNMMSMDEQIFSAQRTFIKFMFSRRLSMINSEKLSFFFFNLPILRLFLTAV